MPPRFLPPEYGFIDPLNSFDPIDSLPKDPIAEPPKYLPEDPTKFVTPYPNDSINDLIGNPIGEFPDLPDLINNRSELAIAAMPSLQFETSLLIGSSYVFTFHMLFVL